MIQIHFFQQLPKIRHWISSIYSDQIWNWFYNSTWSCSFFHPIPDYQTYITLLTIDSTKLQLARAYIISISGWCFQIFFNPYLGKIPILTKKSMGLKPPIRYHTYHKPPQPKTSMTNPPPSRLRWLLRSSRSGSQGPTTTASDASRRTRSQRLGVEEEWGKGGEIGGYCLGWCGRKCNYANMFDWLMIIFCFCYLFIYLPWIVVFCCLILLSFLGLITVTKIAVACRCACGVTVGYLGCGPLTLTVGNKGL